MKITALVGTAALFLLFSTAAPSYAQDQHPQDDKAKPEEKPKPEESKTPHDSAKPQNEAPKDHPADTKEAPPRAQDEHSREQNKTTTTTTRTTRISDTEYKAHFGREHTFHIGHPEIVGGRPHFSYGGYSFVISQPWPAGWGYDDDVYVIDANGVYYLVDVAHPGVQLALVIA